MSNRPGRNARCPCGSGKKYKRCCLAADEAALLERLQQDVVGDGYLPFDADDEDGGSLVDTDDGPPSLDVRSLVRVCYTRGLVDTLSDLRAGRDVRVTEWSAPHIPQTILESLEREGLDMLEGEWGDPESGDPIQVDIIELDTGSEVVAIEVFNRAIGLIYDDSEEIRRIHRVCGALESAAAQERTESSPEGTERAAPVAEPAIDIAAVLKEHRRQRGACALCGQELPRQGARKHFDSCVPAHEVARGTRERLVHLRVTAPNLPAYWLDLEVKARATLDALDAFLRETWLECCGHLSVFDVGPVKYFSRGYDPGFLQPFGGLGERRIVERTMSARAGDALPAVGERFRYEYDFGSTTTLQVAVVAERTGSIGRSLVRLLAQNTAPVWPCETCGEAATDVCAYCFQETDSAFACSAHVHLHRCGETDAFRPVVNSPRMGICGYYGAS